MNPIEARAQVWVCPVCRYTYSQPTTCEHPSVSGINLPAQVVPWVPLSHVQSLEAEVRRLREAVRAALAFHHDESLDNAQAWDRVENVLVGALDTTTEGK